ncbi:YfhO family protein [Parapedobacter koreensis]|uniref:Membrane protein YfhO n=1 Tax=Parapedobacter koreensis TaxID=332977 RepID=A0A1H7QU72_9SPHI|nr:YfhO family protein [Parapedobacter koreensis]SEL51462.1 membrane protein YfhO [Parapedobacter koreensis]
MKTWFNNNSTHLVVIGVFIAICFLYFTPAWQGKVLYQQDVLLAQAGQKEILDIKARDGDMPLWTNSMFGGMPSYQVLMELPSNLTTYLLRGFKAVFPHPVDVVLLYLLGAYLLFSVLKVKPWLAAMGAIAFAFSSYNFIYIEAGHANKTYAIAFMAPILAGILLVFRGKHLWGAVLLALGMALEIRVNHIQVTYYLFLAVLILVGIELYFAIREKRVLEFGKAVGYQAIAVIVALAVNASLLWPTYEYSKETLRGKANLKTENVQRADNGVSREYAYQWSQGVGESLTFLIPNAYGGGMSTQLDETSNVAKVLTNHSYSPEAAVNFATYWGEKEFTSGPWYFGSGVVFLFVLGLFVVKGRLKWWLFATTALVLLLSFGRHFPLVSDLFFNYFPMYNKFRAVESILIIATLLIPILAILTVNEITVQGDKIKKLDKKLLYVLYGVGGIVLLIALLPDVFLSFKSSNHQALIQQYAQQLRDNTFANELMAALVKDRAALARADAFRSLLFIIITFGLIWLLVKNKLKAQPVIVLLGLVTLIDLWSVDKRYLNADRFVDKLQLNRQFIQEREVDRLILMDKDPNYRVFDLTTNPFADSRTSYFHKSIGGYHAAKLMRYQEVIERQFSGAINEDVLDMLNTRYIITRDNNQNSERIQRRNSAAGNAWFVEKVTLVKDNEEEMQAINGFDPHSEAFVHEEFKPLLDEKRLGRPVNATIELTAYRPDRLVYEYSTPNDALAVFSEIWYDKGWKAFVDGKELPILRANYLLRALQLPGGNHKVEFKFEPQSYHLGETISLVGSIILVLGIGLAVWLEVKKKAEPKLVKKA